MPELKIEDLDPLSVFMEKQASMMTDRMP